MLAELVTTRAFDGALVSTLPSGDEPFFTLDVALSAFALLNGLGVYWSSFAFLTIFKLSIVESTSLSEYC